MKAAAQLIVHPAGRHFAQGEERHSQRRFARFRLRRGTLVDVKKKLERDRPRKLRRAAEPAFARVVAACDLLVGGIDQLRIDLPALRRPTRGRALERGHDLASALADLAVVALPRVRDLAQHFEETRLPVAIFRRKISAADKRLERRGEPDIQRPAATAGRGLDEGHVNAIDIRAFLAVDFDVHKARVHEGRDFFVLERLPFHHVAPMAGRVTDREKDRFPFLARLGEGFLAPRIPIDRVMRVLEKVR